PPLPLARLRARGQTVELRAVDLRFTEGEASQFLIGVMGLHLDAGSVALLEERTEGWIAGLQMAALSMRDQENVPELIRRFSGTNRYILDYLLEEVLASQSPAIQRFLLCTSILERVTASLCEAVLRAEKLEGGILDKLSATSPASNPPNCQPTIEYLEEANLFLVPLDDERRWYRYHHLFADLLRARLDQLYPGLAPQLHGRAAAWHEQNGSILEAIHHASMVPDDETVERLIKHNYLEMMNRGELSWVRSWMGDLSRELVYRRPWLCLYEAMNRSWFGQLDEANLLLNEAKKHIRAQGSATDAQSMLGYHAYVESRVTAMQGDTRRAIEYCLAAREKVPADSLDLQIDFSITLGYEYFLYGDFTNAASTLHEMIRTCDTVRAINNPVAAYALLARIEIFQGRLHDAFDLFQKAAGLIGDAGGQYQGAIGLVEVGTADVLCEWNDIVTALERLKQGLELLTSWGKTDDLCLSYITLARAQRALGKSADAAETIKKAAQLIRTCGVFSEARNAVEAAQVKMWLVQGDELAVNHWVAAVEKRFGSNDPFHYEDELAHITQARVLLAHNKPVKAIRLLSCLEKSAHSDGRQGRLIEIMILKSLALQKMGNNARADLTLTRCLELAEPSGYVRLFLDEGQPMYRLLAQWLAHEDGNPLQAYASHLLAQFDAEPHRYRTAQEKVSPTSDPSERPGQSGKCLLEPLSQREVEVLQLMAQGKTNQEIAGQLIVAPGTVKAHTASIYRKLDVANRTEAAARARQLGILP
ncbi:MAG: LuxR C-terminal-related transcriptional regulator, partial [Syntrophothermus sp.]